MQLGVPMLNGDLVKIDHLSVNTAKETLGVWTSPDGQSSQPLTAIQTKAQSWIDRAKEDKLMRRDVWFLLDHQLGQVSAMVCAATLQVSPISPSVSKSNGGNLSH